MVLPLIAGRSSSNELFHIDLALQPHLFVCYSEEEEFTGMMIEFCKQLMTNDEENVTFALAIKSRNADAIIASVPERNISRLYITNNQSISTEDSSRLFMKDIHKEFVKRNKISAKNKEGKTTNRNSKLIIFCDNILEVLIVNNKRNMNGSYFLEILQHGPAVGMHCIVAGSVSYRNLLRQLMNVKIRKEEAGIIHTIYSARIGTYIVG